MKPFLRLKGISLKELSFLNFFKLTKQTARTGVTKVQTRLLLNETQQLLGMKGEKPMKVKCFITCRRRLSNTDRFISKKGLNTLRLHYW